MRDRDILPWGCQNRSRYDLHSELDRVYLQNGGMTGVWIRDIGCHCNTCDGVALVRDGLSLQDVTTQIDNVYLLINPACYIIIYWIVLTQHKDRYTWQYEVTSKVLPLSLLPLAEMKCNFLPLFKPEHSTFSENDCLLSFNYKSQSLLKFYQRRFVPDESPHNRKPLYNPGNLVLFWLLERLINNLKSALRPYQY